MYFIQQQFGGFLMGKQKFCFLLFLGFLILAPILLAKNNNAQKGTAGFAKISALDPPATLSNINNWSYWLHSDGISGRTPEKNAGGIYPRSTGNVINADGLIWGTQVNGNIRVGGQTYVSGTRPSPQLDHIFRIRLDWSTLNMASVLEETAEFYQIEKSAVTETQTNEIIEQYKKD